MQTYTNLSHITRKYGLFAILILVFLTGVASIYSAPQQQPESPVLNETLPYLTLDHYEIPLRDYLETGVHPNPASPSQPDYIPWSKLVYQSYRNNNWDIYLSEGAGSSEIRLTSTGDDEILPRLNRDGTRIVFAYERFSGFEIYIMSSDGTNKVQLTNNETDDVNPYWSPDGSKIVFQAYRDGQAEIYVMNADGSGQTRLTDSGDYDGMPSWSPDGSKIAFVSRRTGGYRVYTMNANGTNQIQRSNQPFSLEPTWSPDSSQIGYSADGDNNTWYEVWLMNADGSSQARKYNPGSEYDALTRSWSPDGQYIAFTKIHYILYQGNWYWTDSHLEGVGVVTGYTNIGPNNPPYHDWYPDWQTTDDQKPSSRVSVLSSVSAASFTVSWSGNDTGGAGIKNYDVQVRDGVNGSWTNWKTATTQTSASYTGIGGHTYYFRSRARDSAYNVESWPTTYDALTTVEALPPQVNMTALPAYSRRQGFTVYWNGADPGGSGIANYDVQYRVGTGGSWTNLLTGTTSTSSPFNGTAGTTYYFRVRGRDNAQNVSAWPDGNGHTFTALYTWAIRGVATNNTGVPISGITTTTTPGAFGYEPGSNEGHYGAYVAPSASNYVVSWGKTGYGSLPTTQFNGTSDATWNVVLPPEDDVIQDGGFESGVFSQTTWTAHGTLPITITTDVLHTGEYAAFLGETSSLATPMNMDSDGALPQIESDENGGVHAIWWSENTYFQVYYRHRLNYGGWSAPQLVSQPNVSASPPQMSITPSGQAHIFWSIHESSQFVLYYSRRNTNGTLTTPLKISGNNHSILAFAGSVNASGRAFAIYNSGNSLYYIQQNSNDTWSTPQTISDNALSAELHNVVKNAQGDIYIFWSQYGNGQTKLYYNRRSPNGTWSTPVRIGNTTGDVVLQYATADAQGKVHLLWYEGNGSLYYQKIEGVSGSPVELVTSLGGGNNLTVDADGNVHIVWGLSHDLYYSKRTELGWNPPELIYTSAQRSPARILVRLSESGTLHLFWTEGDNVTDERVYYSQRPLQGVWKSAIEIAPITGLHGTGISLAVDDNNVPHMMWFDVLGVYYNSYTVATQAGGSAIQQSVTIPVSQTTPTLSFLYWLDGTSSAAGSTFSLKVSQGGITTSLMTKQVNSPGWQHAWVDMTAYAGQTITLTFQLDQVANKPVTSLYLDEVSLGSTQPDVWVEGDYQIALPGEDVTYAIQYGNRGAAAAPEVILNHALASQVTFISASVAPTQVNGQTLSWNLGNVSANTGPVTIFITVRVNAAATPFTTLTSSLSISTVTTELEIANNQTNVQIYLARFLYLPAVAR